jgi:hypothetical protein
MGRRRNVVRDGNGLNPVAPVPVPGLVTVVEGSGRLECCDALFGRLLDRVGAPLYVSLVPLGLGTAAGAVAAIIQVGPMFEAGMFTFCW